MTTLVRCEWCLSSEIYESYHDNEWGVPVHDDQRLFEMLCLEGAQAGLSWITVLKKREGYRKAFKDFDPERCARLQDTTLEKLRNFDGIIRNRLKIESVRKNAHAFLNVQEEYGSFDSYLWDFVDETPIQNRWKSLKEIPAETELSKRLSKDLKKRGFTFVGSTICYAFMQAVGMVNDHTASCFRYLELREPYKKA
ncbi:MAG: DNA-3-methyladenine glycosylase I [Bdellovibrionales bacterium]|nr:DNA-3-methyladenine glycosylase I [Bdellovibrionales bacterium]